LCFHLLLPFRCSGKEEDSSSRIRVLVVVIEITKRIVIIIIIIRKGILPVESRLSRR
jgi:hypothetical protein